MQLANTTSGDDRTWEFIGIWAKNRWEWSATHIANMYMTYTTVGFFDSMGFQAVDYILEQTELTTLFCTMEYVKKIVQMKKDGLARSIKAAVCFDAVTAQERADCDAQGVKLHTYQEVMDAGAAAVETIPFKRCN